jgi:hypothetical protein
MMKTVIFSTLPSHLARRVLASNSTIWHESFADSLIHSTTCMVTLFPCNSFPSASTPTAVNVCVPVIIGHKT